MTEHVISFPPPAPLFNMNKVLASVGAKIRRTKEKAAWRDTACYAAIAHFRNNGIVLPLVPSSVRIYLPVPDARSRDPHNYEPTCKPIVDGLVLAKVWPDDNPKWVWMRPVELILMRNNPMVKIIIRPLEEEL